LSAEFNLFYLDAKNNDSVDIRSYNGVHLSVRHVDEKRP